MDRDWDLSLRMTERYLWALSVIQHHKNLASKVTKELVTGWYITERVKKLVGNEIELALLQDTANATLRSETLRLKCVRCNNRKRSCKKRQKGAKRLQWWMHQTRFRFLLRVWCRAYGSVKLTICDDEEQKKRAARCRRVRCRAYSSLGWTVCD